LDGVDPDQKTSTSKSSIKLGRYNSHNSWKKSSFIEYLELFLESSSLLWNVENRSKKGKKKSTFKKNNMEETKKPCCPSTHKLKENTRLQMNKIAK